MRGEFGQVCSKLWRVLEEEANSYEEMHLMYAPGECARLIRGGMAQDAGRILKAAGLTPCQFTDILVERTGAKYAAFSPLGAVPTYFEHNHRQFGWTEEEVFGPLH